MQRMGVAVELTTLCFIVACALLAFALAVSASAAHAQSILFPLEGDAELIPAHEEELRAVIRDELAARGESVAAVEEYLSGEALVGINWCDECIERLLRERAAERAVIVTLWGEGGSPAMISVTLLDADAQTAEAEVRIEGRTPAEALREAIAGALEAWPARGGVLVRFVGSPEGAAILVDHYPFGTLPALGRLSLGEHVVSVVSDGEVTERQSVEVTASETPLEFDLGGTADPPERASRSRSGRGFIAGPVVLSLGAGALLFEPIRGLVQRGCVQTSRGFCVVDDRIDRGPLAAYATASAALAATAVIWGIIAGRKRRARQPRVELGVLDATIHF